LTSEQWQRVKQMLEEALAQPPEQRVALLARLGREDAALARELESLLAAHDHAGGFLASPALASPEAASLLDQLQPIPTWTGRRVGAYRLVSEIGCGGMGTVYLGARADDAYEKKVAIKVVRSTFGPSVIERRFWSERQILAQLEHPNIARLIDGGATEDGTPYFAMEYVEGLPIDRYCDANGLSVDARLALFLSVCAAVNYAHQHLVVHRDLKASNILVTAEGVPKLLDFGIAKLLRTDAAVPDDRTLTAMRVLTLESASPEQIRGEAVTTATDVYALGVLLHRLLTGLPPYAADTTTSSHDLARAICEQEPTRPSEVAPQAKLAGRLKGDLDTIVLKALQKEPARRYPTVEQFAEDIARHLDGRPVLARPDTWGYRAAKFVRRRRAGVAAAAIIALSLAGGILATAREARVARVERARAERRFDDVRRLANSFLFEFHDAIEDLPGSTKARELVVGRATEYLDRLSADSAYDPTLQRELAAAYDKVGDIQGLPDRTNLGDTRGALRNHRSALALREALVAANRSDRGLQRELETTYVHLSDIVSAMGDEVAAADYGRKGLAIAQALYAANPGGTDERRALASAYHLAGDIAAGLGDWNASRENFRHEVELFELILKSNPGSARAQRDVAVGYKKLGAVLEKTGDRTAALVNYRKAVALDEVRARANANDRVAHLDLSYGYASIGFALSAGGDTAGALDNYGQALAWRQRAAALDRNDVNAQDAVARAHLSIGRVLRNAGRVQESVPHLQEARAIAASRYASDATNRQAAERLGSIHAELADAYADLASAATSRPEALRQWHEARGWSKKTVDIFGARATPGPLTPISQGDLDRYVALSGRSDRELAALADKAAR